MSEDGAARPSRAPFPTTCWSRIAAVREPDAEQAREALAGLCRDYWYPLYAFVRRRGYGRDDAADLVQGLFARLLEGGDLGGVDPGGGRFRSYLMACCRNYLADRRDHDRAAKRGGGRVPIPIDAERAEARYALEPSHDETPERAFDRRWALTILDRALRRLDAEAARSRRPELFARLRPMLEGDRGPALRRIAAELEMSEAAAYQAASRLRARYRAILREEVARTTRAGEDVEDELAVLLAALGG